MQLKRVREVIANLKEEKMRVWGWKNSGKRKRRIEYLNELLDAFNHLIFELECNEKILKTLIENAIRFHEYRQMGKKNMKIIKDYVQWEFLWNITFPYDENMVLYLPY